MTLVKQSDYQLFKPDVMLKKISEFERVPTNANNAYVLQLLETYYQYSVFGAFESEIELRENKSRVIFLSILSEN